MVLKVFSIICLAALFTAINGLTTTLTLTVATTTPTATFTPTCWTTTSPAPSDPCDGIRRRRGILVDDLEAEVVVESDFDEAMFEERHDDVQYGYYSPEPTLEAVNVRSKSARFIDFREDSGNHWMISFVTSTAPTVTQLAPTTLTKTVSCLHPSKIVAC